MKYKKTIVVPAIVGAILSGIGLTGTVYAQTRETRTCTEGTECPNKDQIEHRQGLHVGRMGVTGTIVSIDGTTVTVSGKTYSTDGSTEITYTVDASEAEVKRFSTDETTNAVTPSTIALSDLAVGDNVMVRGAIDGTSVTASNISIGHPGKQQFKNHIKQMRNRASTTTVTE